MIRKVYIFGSGAVREKDEGTVYVDKRPFGGVDMVLDLEKTPWPIQDGGAKHVNATHLIEHVRNFHQFMDECWRILSPGGSMFLEVPNVANRNMAHSDPTHVRYFTKHTFINYLTVEGVHKHGQFQHAWSLLHIDETDKIIRVHLMPVPDEALTDETIAMWAHYKKHESHDPE